ncbi:unnamed protein product, partial [Urochloa humidicola]
VFDQYQISKHIVFDQYQISKHTGFGLNFDSPKASSSIMLLEVLRI